MERPFTDENHGYRDENRTGICTYVLVVHSVVHLYTTLYIGALQKVPRIIE